MRNCNVLKPEIAAVLGAERFVHEIKTTAALQHHTSSPGREGAMDCAGRPAHRG